MIALGHAFSKEKGLDVDIRSLHYFSILIRVIIL